MTATTRTAATVGVVAAVASLLIVLTIAPYGFRISSLLHLDARMAAERPLPSDFVVLQVPAYDGAQYFRIAERLPALLTGNWAELRGVSPGAYAYQRFLLPVLAMTLALGNAAWLPWTFLLINLVCILASAFLVARTTGKIIPAIAVALCPAAAIALHFSTAEPLNILLLTAFLLRFHANPDRSLDWIDGVLLSLCALTREVNFPLVILCTVWFAFRGQWKSSAWTLPALAVFILWQLLLNRIFGSIPFLVNSENMMFPLVAPVSLLLGTEGYDRYTLSSIALFLLFVAPATALTIRHILHEKRKVGLPIVLLAGYLAIMLVMPLHIWGSITSIGRAITPVYPLAVLGSGRFGRFAAPLLIAILALGLAAGFGLVSIVHPFSLSP